LFCNFLFADLPAQMVSGARSQLYEDLVTKEMRLNLFKKDRAGLLSSFIDTIDRVERGISNIQRVAKPTGAEGAAAAAAAPAAAPAAKR
jgi:hypothetical protein